MVIGIEDAFHLKVGGRVDGVQERPLVVKRDVLVAQFALNSTERFNHNLLPGLDALITTFAIIAAWGDDVAIADIGLGVADEDDGEHVHVFGVEFAECGHFDFLLIASRLTDITHGNVGRALLQEQFH